MKKLIIVSMFVLCFLAYEYTSGMNKICVYDCIEGKRALTISSVSL